MVNCGEPCRKSPPFGHKRRSFPYRASVCVCISSLHTSCRGCSQPAGTYTIFLDVACNAWSLLIFRLPPHSRLQHLDKVAAFSRPWATQIPASFSGLTKCVMRRLIPEASVVTNSNRPIGHQNVRRKVRGSSSSSLFQFNVHNKISTCLNHTS